MTGWSILLVFFTSFILFMAKCFLLLIHISVVEDYELSKNASYFLSVALSRECVRILSLSISFFSTLIVSLMIFSVRYLSWWCCSQFIIDKRPDLSQQVDITYALQFEYENMKMEHRKYQETQFGIQLCIDICEIILYLRGKLFYI